VEEITCVSEDFCDSADDLRFLNPLRKVKMIDRPDLEYKLLGSPDDVDFPVVGGKMIRVPRDSTLSQIFGIRYPGIEFEFPKLMAGVQFSEQTPVVEVEAAEEINVGDWVSSDENGRAVAARQGPGLPLGHVIGQCVRGTGPA
jgi:hypothetical protein